MSKVIEFFLGSILIAVFTIALMVFSALNYILRSGDIVDCAWHATARTWLDSNGDGFVNNGELPLRGIEIHVDDIRDHLVDVGWPAITDKMGEVQLNVPMRNCSDTVFEIYADTPEGYRITTVARIEVNRDFWGSLSTQRVYYFGFISDE
ncbi:MAG TPA: hypothetical protein VKE92_14450 [Anaerolineales bacterium]|nr:hypothetical protein [Anaerolineales bacterium]